MYFLLQGHRLESLLSLSPLKAASQHKLLMSRYPRKISPSDMLELTSRSTIFPHSIWNLSFSQELDYCCRCSFPWPKLMFSKYDVAEVTNVKSYTDAGHQPHFQHLSNDGRFMNLLDTNPNMYF